LAVQHKEQLIAAIFEEYAHHGPSTIGQIKYFIEPQFHLPLEQSTSGYIAHRRIKSCYGPPIEEKRINVTTEAIITFLRKRSILWKKCRTILPATWTKFATKTGRIG
jgi:hypothetical protein